MGLVWVCQDGEISASATPVVHLSVSASKTTSYDEQLALPISCDSYDSKP